MDLQNTFYIMGIIFMSIMLILILLLVISVLVIRAKIVSIHDKIEQKLSLVTDLSGAGKKLFSVAKSVTGKK